MYADHFGASGIAAGEHRYMFKWLSLSVMSCVLCVTIMRKRDVIIAEVRWRKLSQKVSRVVPRI